MQIILKGSDGAVHEMSPVLVERIERIAKRDRLSIENAIIQAISNEEFLQGIEDDGLTLFVNADGGHLREVVREPVKSAAAVAA